MTFIIETERTLPFEQLLKIIEKFKSLNVKTVVLTGGEPLLVPSIGEIMRLLHEANISIALSTNTSFFSRFQGEIGKYVTSLNIPLDGSTSEIHARSRANQKTFFACLEVLRYYKNKPSEKPLGSKIVVAPASARDKAYFMVNPKGQVVIPTTDLNGVTHEMVVGDILKNSLSELVSWWTRKINLENYRENHEQHYGKMSF